MSKTDNDNPSMTMTEIQTSTEPLPTDQSLPATQSLLANKSDVLVKASESGNLVEQSKLIDDIKKLISLRIRNEMRVLELIDAGMIYQDSDGSDVISDKAMAMHKASKDSISDLVKVKLNLEGIATERKDVVHSFDVRAMVEAIRSARDNRVDVDEVRRLPL